MRNYILSITRNTIPYVKELRPISGSVTATILMQRLDYYFERHPNGFYKFLEPCQNALYREGDSWIEELNFSKDEFRTAFALIGVSYKSKSLFNKEADPFAGKYYCSYFDRPKGVTYFFRNHTLLDQVLDHLVNLPKTQVSDGGEA